MVWKGHRTERDALQSLRLGSQVVCLYEGPEEKIELLANILEQALSNGFKVLCLLSENDQTALVNRLRTGQINVETLVQKGALAFLMAEEVGPDRRTGRSFDELTAFVETAVRRSIAQGFEGLCFLEVMEPFLTADVSDELLLNHEMRLRRSPVAASSLVVSFYPRDTKRNALLFEVLRRLNGLIFRDPGSGTITILPASVVEDASRNSEALAQMVETLTATFGAPSTPAPAPPSPNPVPDEGSVVSNGGRTNRTDDPPPAALLERLNRGHAELAAARTEIEIAETVVRVLTEAVANAGGWAAIKTSGEGAAFRVAAFRGLPETFVQALDLSAEEEGPFGEALRTRRSVVWRSALPRSVPRGPIAFPEAVLFPLWTGGEMRGAVALYLPEGAVSGSFLSLWVQPLLDHAGARLADVSERAELARRLRARHLPTACLAAPSAAPLAAFSPEGVLLYANPAFLALWEASTAAGLPGQTWTDLLSDPAEAASVWKLVRGTGIFSGILKLRSRDPTVRSFRGQLSLQYNEVGEPLRVVLAILPDSGTDDRARVFERTRNEILAGVSHELFTPLNAVIGFSEMLLEPSTGPLSATQADYLRHILDNGLRLQKLFEKLLAIADEAGRNPRPSEKPVLIFPLLKEVAETFARTQEGKRPPPLLAVESRAREATVRVEPETFRSVLTDLLDNAMKFTPPAGAILVTARVLRSASEASMDPRFPPPYQLPRRGDQHPSVAYPCVEVVIADEGMGVAPDDLESIFEPFTQVRGHPSKRAGLGVGLSYVRKTLALWNGQLWAESEGAGKGSRFVCRLPCDLPEESG